MADKVDDYSQFDRIDWKIVEELRRDGRMTVTELAQRVGLSKTPCQSRLRRIIASGCITGFRAVVDWTMLGEAHVAFAQVKLSDTREKALREFGEAVRQVREVEECHMIAGHFDYLLKVRTGSILAYRAVLGEKISSLPHVENTSTFIAMETIQESGA